MKGRQRYNSGFTLVEVIISSAVMTLGAALLVSMTVDMHRFSMEERMQNEIEQETTLFLDYFSRDTMAAAGIQLTFPGTSKKSEKVIFRIPEFDSLGIRVADQYDYVVYEYRPKTDYITRSVYDDDEGKFFISETTLPFSRTFWASFADGVPLAEIANPEAINNIQASLARDGYAAGLDYSRRLINVTTLRNAE